MSQFVPLAHDTLGILELCFFSIIHELLHHCTKQNYIFLDILEICLIIYIG